MEFTFNLESEEDILSIEEVPTKKFEILSERCVIPRVGSYLGLDISDSSSGVCIFRNGVKHTSNISLTTKDSDEHYEVKSRRELKSRLLELIAGESFNLVIIEDAFQGINPSTTRLLYALNTAIDELILDNEIFADKFVRVSNKTWKSWLFKVDSENRFKGLNDKERIQKCLELLGIIEEGTGFQDRLDATGMLIGYFLNGEVTPKIKQKSSIRVSKSDIVYSYQDDWDFILDDVRHERLVEDVEVLGIDGKHLTESKILELLNTSPFMVHITIDPVVLGSLAKRLGLGKGSGGYLGFWVRRKSLKKFGGSDNSLSDRLSKEEVAF